MSRGMKECFAVIDSRCYPRRILLLRLTKKKIIAPILGLDNVTWRSVVLKIFLCESLDVLGGWTHQKRVAEVGVET